MEVERKEEAEAGLDPMRAFLLRESQRGGRLGRRMAETAEERGEKKRYEEQDFLLRGELHRMHNTRLPLMRPEDSEVDRITLEAGGGDGPSVTLKITRAVYSSRAQQRGVDCTALDLYALAKLGGLFGLEYLPEPVPRLRVQQPWGDHYLLRTARCSRWCARTRRARRRCARGRALFWGASVAWRI